METNIIALSTAREVLLSLVLQAFPCLQSRLLTARNRRGCFPNQHHCVAAYRIDVVNAISNLTIAHSPSGSIAPCYLPSAGRIFEKKKTIKIAEFFNARL